MLILASASPQRRTLLRRAGIKFKVVPSNVVEKNVGGHARQVVVRLALQKARAVARKHPESWVLGADSLVWCKGEILGKPRDKRDALRILRLLNGGWNSVYTGVALVHAGAKKELTGAAVSRVRTHRMPEEWLKRYSERHLDKAGAYSIQNREDPFVEKLVGDFDNVVGLPVKLVKRLLRRARRIC